MTFSLTYEQKNVRRRGAGGISALGTPWRNSQYTPPVLPLVSPASKVPFHILVTVSVLGRRFQVSELP